MAEGAGAAGLAAMLANPERFAGRKRRADPVRRQHRSAHSRLDHGARTGAREPHRVVPPHHSGPAGRARRDRDAASASSAPTSSRSITAGCSSTCRPRAPSSTSRSRRATPRMRRRSRARLPRTAIAPQRIDAGARDGVRLLLREAVVGRRHRGPHALRRGAVRTRTRQRRIAVARPHRRGLRRLAPRQRRGARKSPAPSFRPLLRAADRLSGGVIVSDSAASLRLRDCRGRWLGDGRRCRRRHRQPAVGNRVRDAGGCSARGAALGRDRAGRCGRDRRPVAAQRA